MVLLLPFGQSAWRPLLRYGARYLSSLTAPNEDVSVHLRELMRNVAQPVAIAVTSNPATSSFHGVTLSSFTSLTLHPHPLVAFSLRLPSRMADYIRPPRSRLTVSLLSSTNEAMAETLANPLTDQESVFSSSEWEISSPSSFPPGLRDAIGLLRCEVINSVPLRDMVEERENQETIGEKTQGSELFICRVEKVEFGDADRDSLLHFRRKYIAVSDTG
ncbi:hypothetical protein P7C73_g5803, partial [Tremellales sp. Uapishka_1]